MKRLFVLTISAMFTLSFLHMQATHFLSGNYVMQRIPTASKYSLLPIGESYENDHVRILQNQEVVEELNYKSAMNKISYFVSLHFDEFTEKEISLDITISRGNANEQARRTATKEFICWKAMKYADTFDMRNREKFRPVYRHAPLHGWMNGPNGMSYKDSAWHLYFQHNPYGSQWENMTWGHPTSRDLMNWVFENDAVMLGVLETMFSGSAVVDENNTARPGGGTAVIMYTSAGQGQTQSPAYSTGNGRAFRKYTSSPVIMSNMPDFRGPKIFQNEETGRWNMILAEGQHMRTYSSLNLKGWTHESDLGEDYGNHNRIWECPDLLGIGDRRLLICNTNPSGPFGGSAVQYLIGTFDGRKFMREDASRVTKWMGWDKNHYATVTFSNASGEYHVAIPWMNSWQYTNDVPTKQYRSANGLPHDLGLFSYQGKTYYSVKPDPEVMDTFASKPVKRLNSACRADAWLRVNTVITLSNSQGETVIMIYNARNETFEIDRTKSGDISFSSNFAMVTRAPACGKINALQVFIDKSSIKMFGVDGKMAMSNIVFPSSPYTQLTVKGGKTHIYRLK